MNVMARACSSLLCRHDEGEVDYGCGRQRGCDDDDDDYSDVVMVI